MCLILDYRNKQSKILLELAVFVCVKTVNSYLNLYRLRVRQKNCSLQKKLTKMATQNKAGSPHVPPAIASVPQPLYPRLEQLTSHACSRPRCSPLYPLAPLQSLSDEVVLKLSINYNGRELKLDLTEPSLEVYTYFALKSKVDISIL